MSLGLRGPTATRAAHAIRLPRDRPSARNPGRARQL